MLNSLLILIDDQLSRAESEIDEIKMWYGQKCKIRQTYERENIEHKEEVFHAEQRTFAFRPPISNSCHFYKTIGLSLLCPKKYYWLLKYDSACSTGSIRLTRNVILSGIWTFSVTKKKILSALPEVI